MCDFTTEIKRTFDEGSLLAVADVTVGDVFVVTGVKLINGSKGTFVAMPCECWTDADGEKKYTDIVRAKNDDVRGALYNSVTEAYDLCMQNRENRRCTEMAM